MSGPFAQHVSATCKCCQHTSYVPADAAHFFVDRTALGTAHITFHFWCPACGEVSINTDVNHAVAAHYVDTVGVPWTGWREPAEEPAR